MSLPENFTPAEKGLTLYTVGTPNGYKITACLNLLNLPYKLHRVAIHKGVHNTPWYRSEINPTGRIPTLFDIAEDGTVNRISETNVILQYLTDKYDTNHKISFERGTKDYYNCLEWMSFMSSTVESMLSTHMVMKLNIPAKHQSAAVNKMYTTRLRDFYTTMNKHLLNEPYFVGNKLSIADIVMHAWVMLSNGVDINLQQDYPAILSWLQRLMSQKELREAWNSPRLLPPFVNSLVLDVKVANEKL